MGGQLRLCALGAEGYPEPKREGCPRIKKHLDAALPRMSSSPAFAATSPRVAVVYPPEAVTVKPQTLSAAAVPYDGEVGNMSPPAPPVVIVPTLAADAVQGFAAGPGALAPVPEDKADLREPVQWDPLESEELDVTRRHGPVAVASGVSMVAATP